MKQNEMMQRLRLMIGHIDSQLEGKLISTCEWEVADNYKDAISQAINQLRWRSVEDELPEKYQDVIFMIEGVSLLDGGRMASRRLVGYYADGFKEDYVDTSFSSVTHWMPLPPESS